MTLRKLIYFATCAFVFVAVAWADTAELYGRADGVSDPQLSPNGNKLALQCAPEGVPALCVFDIVNGGESLLIPLGAEKRLGNFYWVNDTYLVFDFSVFETIQTGSGMRDYDFYRAVAFDTSKNKAVMLMRDERNQIDGTQIVAFLPGKKDKVLMTATTVNTSRGANRFTQIDDKEGFKFSLATFEVSLATGKSKRKKTFVPEVSRSLFKPDGEILAQIFENDTNPSDSKRDYSIRVGKTPIFEAENVEISDFSLYGYDADSNKLVVFFDQAARNGLYHMDVANGALNPVQLDGEDAGRAAPIIDPQTQSLVGLEYTNDLDIQMFIHPKLKAVHAKMKNTLAGKSVTIGSWDAARNKFVVRAQAPGKPSEYYVFNSKTGELGGVGNQASHMTDVEMGTVSAINYSARDGLNIPGYLTLPPGKTRADGPFKLVVMPHGGPAARVTADFDWWVQAFAAEGYAVLQPNFRGSTGYGQAFAAAGYGAFGDEMITDVIDGARWAEAQGIAKSGGYCAVGASYGGYSALMMAVLDSGKLGCAASVNGVTDPLIRKSRFSAGSESENYLTRSMGLDEFSSDAETQAITPRKRTEEITAPVLLIHGKEDTRVRFTQAEIMAEKMNRKPGFKLVEMPGEDHFLQSTKARHLVLSETLGFVAANHPAR